MRLQDHRREVLICRIDMTAFLSIQLVLLFSLMATAYGPDLPMNGTDLAKAAHPVAMPTANREDVITVAIQRNGNVWIGNQPCSSPEQLQAGIKEAVAHGSERKVYIRADMRSRYGVLREVLAAVRSAGVENIGFLVDQHPSDPARN